MNAFAVFKAAIVSMCLTAVALESRGAAPGRFINFETAPVHPIALSPDGNFLAVCNLPNGRVDLFALTNGTPVPCGDVPVGIDPVTVRFRTSNELWVVNYISSSVNVVDVARRRVVAVVNTFAGPADVVFAGTPARAFISCARSNVVMVIDPVTRAGVTNVPIDGDMPKAMAVTPDGSRVFVAIFESGNRSTILGGKLTQVDSLPGPSIVDDTNGPYAGVNPSPNLSGSFHPPLNATLPGAPAVSHIVKKNAAGRWLDGGGSDWTEFVSGTNAARSGRVPGWDMPDHDVAVIDTQGHGVSYIRGLMNHCMDLAVNPASGKLGVVGTDGMNEVRFEPNLKSIFLRVNLALADPAAGTQVIRDLNPHLDYNSRSVPQSERDKSIGDPRGIVWSGDGTRGYITGMGSRNLVVVDGDGNRVPMPPVDLEEGASGICLDEARQRAYVLNRFAATVSVLDLQSFAVVQRLALLDPTPAFIRAGRRLFYDTRETSGLGQAACASCHVDGRFDRLAWDLGDPSQGMITNVFGTFHPMKGPKVTQTLQGINPQGALHWRGDRDGIGEFAQTFVQLLGDDGEPASTNMAVLGEFLQSMFFPPNPLRNFDNTVSTNVPLPGQFAYDVETQAPGSAPLPNGNALRGGNLFSSFCSSCHNPGSGLGDPSADSILAALGRNGNQPFKTAQLRSLAEKVGFDMSRSTSRSGFGFSHDGRADTLPRFLADGFGLTNIQDAADLTAMLLSFAGSDITFVSLEGFEDIDSNLDGPAALGRQYLLTNSIRTAEIEALFRLTTPVPGDRFSSDPPEPRLELVAHGGDGTNNRSWYFIEGFFQADRDDELIRAADLLSLASPTNEIVLMPVSRGTARRIAADRDNDWTFDGTELLLGMNPYDPQSTATNTVLSLREESGYTHKRWPRLDAGVPYTLQFVCLGVDFEDDDAVIPSGPIRFSLSGEVPAGAAIDENGLFTWTPTSANFGRHSILRCALAMKRRRHSAKPWCCNCT